MLAWEWRDPMQVAERRQRERQRREAACGQCIHHVSLTLAGQAINRCSQRRAWGWRCWMYEERK
jgi:hypothetical protein